MDEACAPVEVFAAQRAAFRLDPFPPARERQERLLRLERVLVARQDELAAALDRDFEGRSPYETLFAEVQLVLRALRGARRSLPEWMQPRPCGVDLLLQPATSHLLPQPLGVAGIIVPWNYPILLTFAPLAGALAAGNRVMVKLPEQVPNASAAIAALLAQAFPSGNVAAVTGDASVGRAFSSLPFDHLLFTGSTQVGREVMRAAAENLTPVTLELGGKSPAIVAPCAGLARAASDIAYGKLLNVGQTCIAPDYVLVPRALLDAFVTALTGAIEKYWPGAATNGDYTSIVNARHAARLRAYIEEARERGAAVIEASPAASPDSRRLTPTIVLNPPPDIRLMQEEIFGPILPVVPYDGLDEAIEYVNARPHPLALYVFARRDAAIREVLRRTVAGAVCVNDTLVHIASEDLPFGGIGASGMGRYHGRAGFDTFSHLKPVFRRSMPGLGRLLRPPYGRMARLLRRFLIR
jgi:coniferyl-aldehyde dehydrogenase